MQHHETVPLIPISHGRGAWLYDTDGRRYLDAISSWWVNLFGHANPRINAALKDQLDTLEHAMLAGFTHEPVVQLSEQLAARTGGVLGHCFYASDGASAVEIALKMSFHYWRNSGQAGQARIRLPARQLSRRNHRRAGGDRRARCSAMPTARCCSSAHVVASPDARSARDGESAADVARRAAAELETLLQQRAGQIAALIVEPLVQCATGMAMHDPVYLQPKCARCATATRCT